MHYNIIKTAAGARTRLRLPMVWKEDAVAAEELPEAVFWVFIGGERVRVEKTPGSDDEYIFPAMQAGQYAWDLVVDQQLVLHGVLKVRGSAVPPGGGEVCGTLLVDAPAMVLVLSPGPRGEVGPVGPQGLSAYEVALHHGYEGSEADWAEELSGAQAAATAAKEQATEAGKQATAAVGSATAAAASATTASEQATAAANSATAAAASATTAGEQATAASNSATAAAGSAITASEQATAADKSATAAASSATTAGKQATAASNSAKAAAASADTASEQATAAASSAKEAAASADTAGEQATAAANSATAAASSATTASEQASAAANSATAAATAADAVKYDLLPMSVDWLDAHFTAQIGADKYRLTLEEEEKTLSVDFLSDVSEEQKARLLLSCERVLPQNVDLICDGIPTKYTVLEYLESSGTQYVDFAYAGSIHTGLRGAFRQVTVPMGTTMYAINRTGNSMLSLTATKTNYSSPLFDFGLYEYGYASHPGKDYMGDMEAATNWMEDSSGSLWWEDNYSAVRKGSFDADGTFASFRMAQARALHYWYKVSEGQEIAHDFVPVLDQNDTPCMYDKISRQCFYNSGAGTFGYRIKATGEEFAPLSLRDPYYTAPSGVYARLAGENTLEILADTEETSGEGWEWFANTADAYEHFGIVPQEEFSTE